MIPSHHREAIRNVVAFLADRRYGELCQLHSSSRDTLYARSQFVAASLPSRLLLLCTCWRRLRALGSPGDIESFGTAFSAAYLLSGAAGTLIALLIDRQIETAGGSV